LTQLELTPAEGIVTLNHQCSTLIASSSRGTAHDLYHRRGGRETTSC
jgi:hypothetical protein